MKIHLNNWVISLCRRHTLKHTHLIPLILLKMKGKFQTLVESRKRITVASMYVTAEDGGCLLSNDTAQELGLKT